MDRHFDRTSTTTSISYSRATRSASRSASDDDCIPSIRRSLIWNLEDLSDCLTDAETLTRDDLVWYLARVRRIFRHAFPQHETKGNPYEEDH